MTRGALSRLKQQQDTEAVEALNPKPLTLDPKP